MLPFQNSTHERTKQVVHYIISHTDPAQLGATKLAKIMWHADVLHYRRHGKTISGQMSYIRRDHGPMPHGMYEALDSLKRNEKIVERPVATFGGTRREFFDVERANAGWFTPHEVETILEAISTVAPLTATEASERTHGPLWNELRNGEQMSIRASSIVSSEVLEEDVEWALENKEAFAD